MKHIVVGILASHKDVYDALKQVWEENIKHYHTKLKLNKTNQCTYDFVFIYGSENYQDREKYYWTDLYTGHSETARNMLRKTITFYEYIEERFPTYDLILRTNVSTLFDFRQLNEWFINVPVEQFFGGSMINGPHLQNFDISGTNMVISRDLVQCIIQHQYKFAFNLNEDVEMSRFIMNESGSFHKSMKRMDFLDGEILYHRCTTHSVVFCYRFKSNDRMRDVELMRQVMIELHEHGTVKGILKSLELPTREEVPELSFFSEHIWYHSSKEPKILPQGAATPFKETSQ